MKQILLFLTLLLFSLPSVKAQNLEQFFEQSHTFFLNYAHHNHVQYKKLQQDPKTLHILVNHIAKMDLSKAKKSTQKAFFINAYNLLVISSIVKHYPIASPNEVVTFWDEIEHTVAEKNYTLEVLKKHILEIFRDPLLHLVLVDGAISSAPIVDYAYVPTEIDNQLEQRAIVLLNDPKYIQYNEDLNEVKLPLMFKMNRLDFGASTIDFINQYRVRKLPREVQVIYANYDWRLNGFYEDTNITLKKKEKKVGYSPSLQVITLPKGSLELMFFNSLYTVTYGDENYGTRNSYYNGYFSAFYGVTGKLDIGATFLLRSSIENDRFNASPFKTFAFERSTISVNSRASGPYTDWGLSHVGLNVRFAPFKNFNMSFEQGFMFPIQNLPKENTVDDKLYSVTQVYYSHSFTSQTQLFLALTFWQPISIGNEFKFQLPLLRGFFNYFVTPRFSAFVTTMYLLEWGVGVKYMLTPKLEIQGMYSYYIPIPGIYDIVSPGANTIMTYNLGLRYRF